MLLKWISTLIAFRVSLNTKIGHTPCDSANSFQVILDTRPGVHPILSHWTLLKVILGTTVNAFKVISTPVYGKVYSLINFNFSQSHSGWKYHIHFLSFKYNAFLMIRTHIYAYIAGIIAVICNGYINDINRDGRTRLVIDARHISLLSSIRRMTALSNNWWISMTV